MTSAKEIARAFVDMILSEDVEYVDISDFIDDYDPEAHDEVSVEEIYERVLEYMVQIRDNFNAKR